MRPRLSLRSRISQEDAYSPEWLRQDVGDSGRPVRMTVALATACSSREGMNKPFPVPGAHAGRHRERTLWALLPALLDERK